MSLNKLLLIAFIALPSFYLGWLARAFDQTGNAVVVKPLSIDAQPLQQQAVLPQSTNKTDSEEMASNKPNYLHHFRHLLNSYAVDEAMSLFDRLVAIDENVSHVLRSDVISYLQSYMESGQNESLMALIDLYLSRYYDDIDVLLILAEYQRLQGYPDEAARVFHLAFTYAYQPRQEEKISAAFLKLVEKTNQLYSEQKRWVELLGFYDLLDTIDLNRPLYQLQQALVYQHLGDIDSAKVLLRLLADDIRWGGKALEMLQSIDQKIQINNDDLATTQGIPLVRQGNHYLIQIKVNDQFDLTLMIDTGASVTSISQKSFTFLSEQSDLAYKGSRLFNTANGVAKGEIFTAAEIGFGNSILKDVDLAVLDFTLNNGVDGLLGMNVLKYFRFEIDQDKKMLFIQPR
jgi:clan AA aspartic protease (TIGR02281 family)